jgi:hypothetical protein
LAHVFLPIAAVPNRSAWRDVPHNAAREDQWCKNAAGACVKLTVFLGNDERCFLITIGESTTALSGSCDRLVKRGGLPWAATSVSEIRERHM